MNKLFKSIYLGLIGFIPAFIIGLTVFLSLLTLAFISLLTGPGLVF